MLIADVGGPGCNPGFYSSQFLGHLQTQQAVNTDLCTSVMYQQQMYKKLEIDRQRKKQRDRKTDRQTSRTVTVKSYN